MDELNIPYEFGGWQNSLKEQLNIDSDTGTWTHVDVPNPYFVGEYNEVESTELEENGFQETTFILTGTGTKWIDLENAKNKIKKNLPQTAILEDKSGIAVFYGHSLVIATGDAELKRIQINLTIKEWRVN